MLVLVIKKQKWLIHLRQWHQHQPEAKAKAETKQSQDYRTTTSTTTKEQKRANHSWKNKIWKKVFSKSSTPNFFPPWRAPKVDECILHWEVSRSVTLSTVGINLVDDMEVRKEQWRHKTIHPACFFEFCTSFGGWFSWRSTQNNKSCHEKV